MKNTYIHSNLPSITAVALAYVFSGCGSPADLVNGSNNDAGDIVGTWLLITMQRPDGDNIDFRDDEVYSIAFGSAGLWSGSVDCNSCSGGYEASDGGGLSFIHSGMLCTQVLCRTPSNEAEYLHALRSADEFEVSNGELRIGFGEGGVLVYVPQAID